MSRFEKVMLRMIGKLEVVVLQYNVDYTGVFNFYSKCQWKLYLWRCSSGRRFQSV